MVLFKTIEDFDKFCDESMFCVCKRLMTGLHMQGCNKLAKTRFTLEERLRVRGER
ncbi:hypothetical protein LCGC14_0464840 [marine sediment metagenome]|uniref:Uncharacterized protein n=1 Tax=marine sediment metagenome TaxID=412755 RepID=A0A0F9SWY6_9ZZZZ